MATKKKYQIEVGTKVMPNSEFVSNPTDRTLFKIASFAPKTIMQSMKKVKVQGFI